MQQDTIDNIPPIQLNLPLEDSLKAHDLELFSFDISFIIRASIGIILYSIIVFSDFFQELLLAFIISPIIQSPLVSQYIQQLASGDLETINTISNIIAQNIIYVLLVVIIVPLFLQEIKKSFSWIAKHPLYLFVIPCAYFANIVLSIFATIVHTLLLGPIPTSVNQQSIEMMINSPIPWGTIFPIIFAAPIVEELIFRCAIAGLVYTFLAFTLTYIKKNKTLTKGMQLSINIGCVVISATLFGLLHVVTSGDFTSVTPYVVSGITLTSVYLLTKKNIILAIATHMFMNTISYLLIILFSNLL